MNGDPYFIKTGTVVAFSVEEWEDRYPIENVVAIRDIDMKALTEKYRDEVNPDREEGADDPELFPNWLIENGYAVPIATRSIWLGSYGQFADFTR